MPIYEYQARDNATSCTHCLNGFEVLQKISDPPLQVCPRCNAPVGKIYSPPAVGCSQSGYDDRAKSAGFHKLKRLGKGEYEKLY